MAPTPSSKSNQSLKTPQSSGKHRTLHFNSSKNPHPSPNPNRHHPPAPIGDHPVEVIGRIRDHPDRKEKQTPSILQLNPDKQTLRVRADFGYRDFTLDGVSISGEEDLDAFYSKFVESRISGVKLGAKCTIMMYGPTGSGKSHTMFGCPKQPGIVYRALKGILGDGEEESGGDSSSEKEGVGGVAIFVQVTVLEIYNEEIYDLLSSNGSGAGGGLGLGWPKGSASKVKLEVMGKKAKNASFICGSEAGKILKEIQKVEKRRIVKSTLCNDRSSRSHCMIILDVPTVGGRLMLVDMAGSENIEQAGQVGFEAKMQTGKINQGNIALKRVVESIANGDSHVPFRDSKLTMLLQDSFEDDKSKILMVLCASPDPKEIHKTISTLEYGAKAKCIIRGAHTPVKDKFGGEDSSSGAAEVLGTRIAAMDQFIYKLQMENKQREKERNEAKTELMRKEQEVAALRATLELVQGKAACEEEIDMKVNERTKKLRVELEKKLEECQRMANEFVESERRRMEEKILQQQQEVEMLRRRLVELESQVGSLSEEEGSGFAKRLMSAAAYTDDDPGMVKSMDLDTSDLEPPLPSYPIFRAPENETSGGNEVFASKYGDKVCLSTVFEEEEAEEEEDDNDEVEKQVIEEKRVLEPRDEANAACSRRVRIQNIFTLCGNHRELSRHTGGAPTLTGSENVPPPQGEYAKEANGISKENYDPSSTDNKGNQKPAAAAHHLPLSSLENKLEVVASHFSSQQVAKKLDVVTPPPFAVASQHSNLIV